MEVYWIGSIFISNFIYFHLSTIVIQNGYMIQYVSKKCNRMTFGHCWWRCEPLLEITIITVVDNTTIIYLAH